MSHLKEHTTPEGSQILYTGNPNLSMINDLAKGPGDLWHSGPDQGLKDTFQDIIYQTSIFWFYLNDYPHVSKSVSWRINPNAFAIRKKVWEHISGFDTRYTSNFMQALDLGFNMIKNYGGVPLYIENLYTSENTEKPVISTLDTYIFFRKNFKPRHSIYLLINKFLKSPLEEYRAFTKAGKQIQYQNSHSNPIPPRTLLPIQGSPVVSYIIPTMYRQQYTLQLLDDLEKQSYHPGEVIIVDATPPEERQEAIYLEKKYPFEVKVVWQTSKGSCRARNEAIELATGTHIVFGDDDIRIPDNFIENHLRLLQTYGADACNGLDIMADNPQQDLNDLQNKIAELRKHPVKVGVTPNFSNANSCVKKEWVERLTGNDINYDGGYGEDSDFGLRLLKAGAVVLFNPYSVNLHLKPNFGGYRFWGLQARLKGKKRKTQPWEKGKPVKYITPVPSPTIMYYNLKHFKKEQLIEYKKKHILLFLSKGSPLGVVWRLLKLPYRLLQYNRSKYYAKALLKSGPKYK